MNVSDTTQSAQETMTAITRAVELGRTGSAQAARDTLLEIWAALGPQGDPLHRCTLAHYLADLYDDPAQALCWDVRALDAADGLTDERLRRHDQNLDVRGFYPSLHLNLADNYRRLGSFDAAQREIDAAQGYVDALGNDGYGAMIRTAIDEVAAAIRTRTTARRASAPHGHG
ncbi:hypothetical protein AB0L63_26355 [Nocardia sp. NPDC051990]|uniref:hypothetical protein n=1 Tax=Nocardia sp. NPDC051990 TaxID=3155285 RepID=UPI003415C4FE